MASNLVIAAIPGEDDRVWKVSSEKVPHLTILHLGDVTQVANLESIVQFVEHAVNTSLRRFYLPVDRRGELGADQADVLFFKKGRYDFKAVRDFRSLLLKDSNIKTAYDSSTQFEVPEEVGEPGQPWIPHLTLGYPASPAKPMPDEYTSLYEVCFDKIAVWTGDYEGTDFLLKDHWDEIEEMGIPMDVPLSVAYSDMEHHGVKGQKWGVRKVEGGGEGAHIRINNKTGQAAVSKQSSTAIIVPALIMPPLIPIAFLSKRVRSEVKAARAVNQGVNAQKKIDKADKKFEKRAHSAENFVAIHNGAHEQITRSIDEINKKYPQDLTKDATAKKNYDDEITKSMQDAYRASANQLGNKSGTRHLDVEFSGHDGMDFKIVAKKGMQTPTVQHAVVDDSEVFAAKVKRDATGHIVGFEFDDFEAQSMAQTTSDLGAQFLEHHGVKGMRWGVRRAAQKTKVGLKRVGSALLKLHANLADSSWENSIYSDSGHEEVHNHVAENIDHHVDKLARSPKYREKNLRTDRDLQREYYQDVARVTDVAYRKAVKDVYGENYTGTKKARYIQDPRGPRIEIRDKKTGDLHDATPLSSMRDINKRREEAKNEAFVQKTLGEKAVHAATAVDVPDISIALKLNDLGQISGVTFVNPSDTPKESMAQTADIGAKTAHTMELGEAFLTHYGVKGMRWGQRREEFVTRSHQRRRTTEAANREKRPARDVEAFPTIGTSKRAKAKVNTTGGHDHPPTEDAIKVAVARQKLEKSGVAALSNHELQVMERRLNLETNVQRLAGGNKTAGQKFVDGLLGRSDKKDKSVEGSVGNTVRDVAGPHIQKQVTKQVLKRFATA